MKNNSPDKEKHISIKYWIEDERPREMLQKIGAENLAPSKLLAILLRTGTYGISAEDIAKKLMNHFKSIRGLDQASIEDLCIIDGIGKAKAIQIKAALELGKRLAKEKVNSLPKLQSPEEVVHYVADEIGIYHRDFKKEIFSMILLNVKNKPLKTVHLTMGTVDTCMVDPREVILQATKLSASAIILVHNHPSGETTPSKDDMHTTHTIIKACQLVQISVLDHIIIGSNETDYYSFAKNGLITSMKT
jgi:DNA repair protein RadC